jgi:hypothetical protein
MSIKRLSEWLPCCFASSKFKMASQTHFGSNADSSAAMAEEAVLFNNKQYKSWKDARKAYDSVSSKGKPGSVWSMLALTSADPGNQDLPFQLRCRHCDQSCQLRNPSKWKRDH